MKKRLLFAFMALCASVSGFALEQGEFVYTPQGRFQITGQNLNANNAFQNMDGWTVIGEGKTLNDKFNTNANGLADGMNSVVSVDGETLDEGMYFKFEPTDASAAYVVSFKMKGALLDNVRCRPVTDGYKKTYNLVKIEGNSDNVYGGENDVKLANTAEELNPEWKTFYYAIEGDGTARTWFISFVAMSTSIEIADLQIAPAVKFADLRERDDMVESLQVIKNCYDWPAEVLADYGFDEVIAKLQAIGDEAGQAELEEALEEAGEIAYEFINANMDDYLAASEATATTNAAGSPKVDVKFSTWYAKVQKAYTWGDWNCLPSGRGFWEKEEQGAADFGHFAGNSAWNGGSPDGPMGIYMSKTFDPGVYVFSLDSKAALREDNTSSSWTNNEGWDPAYGIAYIGKLGTVKDADGNDVTAVTDTIASMVKDLESLNFTGFNVIAKIEEAGAYEVGYKAYCKDGYKDLKNGSVVYIKDVSIWGKNNNKYNQKQLGYEQNVRTQISAGRDNLTTAAGYLADESFLWGKAALKAVVDEVGPKIAEYEAMDQDAIIATFDQDTYVNSTSDEAGLLQYQVYQEATKFIIAANKEFLAENDTLASIQTAIDAAEATKAMRLYDAATGKDALQAIIDKAKGVQATMKAADYSEANALAIREANAELAEAVAVFKTTIPASAIATIVDIDFENDATQNADNELYSVAGAKGAMEFSTWSVDGTGNQPFEKGFWSNGEQLWKGYIRIGNGTGTVVFDPTENGSMGTNILKVACDLYVQGLSGRSLGFFLKNVVDGENGPEDATIFGLFHNFYNGTTETNTTGVDISKIWAKSGGSYDNASPADADEETLTANPLQKSHVEVIMDYGRKSMYCTINSVNGSTASNEVGLDTVPTKFILQCNYNNNNRRAWFDNLKIERISAGATEPFVDAINSIKAASQDNVIYNLAGQKVMKAQKGVFIQNGKKVIK